MAKSSMGWLWHRRLAHVGMRNLAKLLKDEHILRLTNVHFEKDRICSTCQDGKQVGVPHPPKSIMTSKQPLELIDMDLFGLVTYLSIRGNKYRLIIVDDFSPPSRLIIDPTVPKILVANTQGSNANWGPKRRN